MIYDCFTFFNEFDILEIRLNELNDVVDYFVLVEADHTFQFDKKPFYFEENKERFSKFLDKIIHIKVNQYPKFIPILNPFSPWKIEYHQRDMIKEGLKNCQDDDLILISDVDEIPKKHILKKYYHTLNEIIGLRYHMFYYYFNYKISYDPQSRISRKESSKGTFNCAALAPYKLVKKEKIHVIRKNVFKARKKKTYSIIPDAGWHFSYLGDIDMIINKIESFSHTEFNYNQFKNKERLINILKEGKDLFDRNIEFEKVDLTFLPKYLQNNVNLYKPFFLK